MSASPAVILSNIPSFLTNNGRSTAIHVLGSKTGAEVGACYWKLHPNLPRFMVVFKHRVDRDNWFNTSTKLKEMIKKGVVVNTAWYSRDRDEVLEEKEGIKFDTGRERSTNLGGGSYMKLLEEREQNIPNGRMEDMKKLDDQNKILSLVGDFKKGNLSVDNMSALSAEIEDLDKLATSRFIFAQKNKVDNLVNTRTRPPPPLIISMESFPLRAVNPQMVQIKSSPSSYNLRSAANATPKLSQIQPVEAQDFSIPPPPLRLPLHVKQAKAVNEHVTASHRLKYNSNILARLEEAVKVNLENDKENQIIGDIKNISRTVAQSWKSNIDSLEKIYEAVLSDANLHAKLTQELDEIYDWAGSAGVTRDQALVWTKEFLVKAGMKVGSDMEECFTRFLTKINKQFRINSDEVKFIMLRNGLDMVVICRAFSENSNSVGFRNFIRSNVNISGQLLNDFSGVFLEFFRSRVNQESKKSMRKSTPLKQSGGNVKESSEIGSKIELKLSSQNIKEIEAKKGGIKYLVKDLDEKVKYLSSCNDDLETRILDLTKLNSSHVDEVKLIKEEFHEKLRVANQENKLLRARNSNLQEDVGLVKEELKKVKSIKLEIVTFLDKFAEAVASEDIVVEQLLMTMSDDEEIGKLKNSLKSMIKSKQSIKEDAIKKTEVFGCGDVKNGVKVTLVLKDENIDSDKSVSNSMVVYASQGKLVNMVEVEMAVGKKVIGLKYRQGKGKGWRNLKVVDGLAYPPEGGWGNREYLVVLQDGEAALAHLGQGCVSTPGHSRRQESNVREGPMFPPHVGGPRI